MTQSTFPYSIANESGAAFRADVNLGYTAIASLNAGTTAPSPTFAQMFWADTANGLLKQRNQANSAWVTKGNLDDAYWGLLPNTLNSARVFVGNASNVATGVAISGDASIDNAGAVTISKIGGKSVSLSGSLTGAGAYSLSYTLSGNTSIIFPTSGTLATQSGAEVLTNKTTTSLIDNGDYSVTRYGINPGQIRPVWAELKS